MPKKYIIIYDRIGCIGAAACEAVAPTKWKVINNKATLIDKNAIKTEEHEALEIDEDQLEEHLEAAKACPVNVIKIKEKESGREVI